jgi:hypothetical protein
LVARRVIGLAFLCVIGCGPPADAGNAAPAATVASVAPSEPAPAQRLSAQDVATVLGSLLSTTPELVGDTIHVWSPALRDDSTWTGVPVDSGVMDALQTYYPALSPKLRPFWGFYSVARVRLGEGVTGFIVRTPGQYDVSQLDLLVYLSDSATFLPPIELAEAWGDAGEWYREESILADVNGDGRRDVVRHLHRTAMDIENDPPGPDTASDSVWLRMGHARGFALPSLVSTALPPWARYRSIP